MAPAALLLPIPVDLAVGGSFLAAGAVAWRRRPENRTGLLMVLSGIAWFCRDFARWDAAVPRHLGELSLNVFLALIAHQVVVFPYGVARTRVERGLVGAVYALAFGGYADSRDHLHRCAALARSHSPGTTCTRADSVGRPLSTGRGHGVDRA